jgi:hypothetical protein
VRRWTRAFNAFAAWLIRRWSNAELCGRSAKAAVLGNAEECLDAVEARLELRPVLSRVMVSDFRSLRGDIVIRL